MIALAVIFLPMLLVGPDDEMATESMDFEIPPRPSDAREVRRIPLDPEAARIRQNDQAAVSDPTVSSRALQEETPAQALSDLEPAQSRPEQQPDEIVLRPEVQAQAAPEPAAPAESTVASDAESGSSESDDPITRPVDVAAPAVEAATAGGSWVVQVASFSSDDSARTVRQRLEALGHRVIQDQITQGSTTLIRLKTGPYADEAAAGRARAQIGTTVQGVSPIVRRSELPAAAASTGVGEFAVQVGSFASQANAERETGRLSELGFDAFRFSEEAAGRQIWRVRVGPVADRPQAAQLQSRLSTDAGVEGLIVSHP